MKKYFSISEAAKIVGTTAETLRHYDRIGLVKPHEKDAWTGYRYYSEQEIVRLNTIQALRLMDLSLKEIKEVLAYNDLSQIIAFLKKAEKSADEKMAKLQYAKRKIALARADYEKKWAKRPQNNGIFTQAIAHRVILLSPTLTEPSLDNLWNYHSHFFKQLPENQRENFSFEDLAGIYTSNGASHLFAVCIRYVDIEGLKALPAGTYLCANCTEQNRQARMKDLLKIAWEEYNVKPGFIVQLVVVSGILQWNYQIQILLQ